MGRDLSAALDALTRNPSPPPSSQTLTAAANYGTGASNDVGAELTRLMEGSRTTLQQKTLPAVNTPPAIPARVGRGNPVTQASGGSGGGVASPLTELNVALRTYYADAVWQSSDGFFNFLYSPLQSMTFQDANGATVVFNFATPP